MRRSRVRRSTVSFNCVASACQKSLHWEGALALWSMGEKELEPDIVTLSLVIAPLQEPIESCFNMF